MGQAVRGRALREHLPRQSLAWKHRRDGVPVTLVATIDKHTECHVVNVGVATADRLRLDLRELKRIEGHQDRIGCITEVRPKWGSNPAHPKTGAALCRSHCQM